MTDAIELIVVLVRNVALGRAMYATGIYPHLNFWRVLQSNTMDMAAIDWCKLFGSDDRNRQPAHWKNVVPAARHDTFRAGLLEATGLSADEWDEYRFTILEYRNTMAAHLDEPAKRPPNFPSYDIALLAASYYYSHIMSNEELRAAHAHYPQDLLEYEEDFRAQALEIANVALAATEHMTESVR